MRAAAQSCNLMQMVIYLIIYSIVLFHQTVAAAPYEPFTQGTTTDESLLLGFFGRIQKNGVDNIEVTDFILCSFVIMCAFELLNFGVKRSGYAFNAKLIPVRGKHLDDFSVVDYAFITLNKLATIPFVYFLLKFMYHEPNAVWSLRQATLANVLLPIVPFFIIYDFFYTLLHWVLHIQSIYGFIHKHHHRQKAPSRANTDAVNVHPIEFFLGEYNHLFAIFLYTHILGLEVHILMLPVTFAMAAFMTGLNHTRFDAKVIIKGLTLYDSKWHDVHHRIPQSNYGQYTNFWDRCFGTFRTYDPNDRVNPINQLDPKTGKSLGYAASKRMLKLE